MLSAIRAYFWGFIIAALLTLISFFAVTQHWFARHWTILFISAMAILQLLTQMRFFLHIGLSPESRPRLLTFLFTVLIIMIIVGGSLWIMHNLHYFMMDPIMAQMPDHSH